MDEHKREKFCRHKIECAEVGKIEDLGGDDFPGEIPGEVRLLEIQIGDKMKSCPQMINIL